MAFNLQKNDLTTIFVRYFLHVRSSVGSDGWGVDILGYLWPKPNLEEKKSSQRRLWIEERADIASDRIFVSDDETYEFYGFNTTYLDKG